MAAAEVATLGRGRWRPRQERSRSSSFGHRTSPFLSEPTIGEKGTGLRVRRVANGSSPICNVLFSPYL